MKAKLIYYFDRRIILDVGPETYIGREHFTKGPVDIDLSGFKNSGGISRLHAAIYFNIKENAYYLEDLNSTYGTHVRRGTTEYKIRGKPFRLQDGDIICFYRECFIFKVEGNHGR